MIVTKLEKPKKIANSKELARQIRERVSEGKNAGIPNYEAHTCLKIVKNLSKEFGDLYPVSLVSRIFGVSESCFRKWQTCQKTYLSSSFVRSWEKVKLLAEIHISLSTIFQNNEGIVNALLSEENEILGRSMYELIIGGDIQEMLSVKYFLNSIEG